MRKFYFDIFFIGVVLFFSATSFAGKKQCKPYLAKLHNIQAQQKQGHSLKRSESLNKREAKARKKWWQCERGLLKKAKRNKKKQKKVIVKRQPLPENSRKNSSKGKLKPFQTSRAVVVKSRYQGKQLQAWILYYQQPKKCQRPKSTKQFAFCVENRRAQQIAFEKVDATVDVQ